MLGQYLGPVPSIDPEYTGDKFKFFRIILNMEYTQYSPLSLLENIDDNTFIEMVKSGKIQEFCIALTLDLHNYSSETNC